MMQNFGFLSLILLFLMSCGSDNSKTTNSEVVVSDGNPHRNLTKERQEFIELAKNVEQGEKDPRNFDFKGLPYVESLRRTADIEKESIRYDIELDMSRSNFKIDAQTKISFRYLGKTDHFLTIDLAKAKISELKVNGVFYQAFCQ